MRTCDVGRFWRGWIHDVLNGYCYMFLGISTRKYTDLVLLWGVLHVAPFLCVSNGHSLSRLCPQ